MKFLFPKEYPFSFFILFWSYFFVMRVVLSFSFFLQKGLGQPHRGSFGKELYRGRLMCFLSLSAIELYNLNLCQSGRRSNTK
jgi:hypothetical protein